MTEETQVSPAETQIPAETPTNETPEVVTEETTEQTEPQVSDKDERDKAIARMERRINRKHAEAAEAKAERDFLRERLQKYEAQNTEQEPQDLDREVNRRAQQLAEAREFDRQCNEVAAKGAKKFTDFNAAVNALATEIPLFGRNNEPTAAMKVLLEADNPPALLHYLGKNPDLASELADLTPTQLSRRLDRIEREMATPPKPSSAPKPLDPVKPAGSESGLSAAKSDEEWARMRDKELRERHKR